MIVTGVYHVVALVEAEAGVWDARFHDADLLNRDDAIEWVNRNRPTTPKGTLYRLFELTQDELNEILEDEDDEDAEW